MLDRKLLNDLISAGIVHRLFVYDAVDSTNVRAHEFVSNTQEGSSFSDLPHLFVADNQTNGKGRLGRSWDASEGQSIAMSYLCKPNLSTDLISGITLLAALAVVDGIDSYCIAHGLPKPDALIKWPNDVVISGKKICGILTELVSKPTSVSANTNETTFSYQSQTETTVQAGSNSVLHYVNHVICGIGINVNTPVFSDDIKDKATSLMLEYGTGWKREELICLIVERLGYYISEYEKHQSLDFITEKYNNLLVSRDKEVILSSYNQDDPLGVTKGSPVFISRGIDKTGALLVEDKDGNITAVSSGEVSVRGLYGYVL